MSYKEAQIEAALVGVLLLVLLTAWVCVGGLGSRETTEPVPAPTTTTPTTTTTAPELTETTGDPFYALTEYERDLVERVVMAEAGGEPYQGQMAVAQCILNASRLREMQPAQVVKALKYTKARPTPSKSVKKAVAAVFDEGETVFDDEVIYFYAPALVTSTWHESQTYVTTIGCHKFFKEAK